MFVWHSLVSFLVALLWALAQLYGGNLGLAIVTLSLIVRLSLVPVTVRIARHAHAQQEIFLALRDDIAKLKARHRASPERLASELSKLYQKHGVRPVSTVSVTGGFLQFITGAALYSAIKRGVGAGGRFLWIADLARPDVILAVATGVLTFVASLVGPHLPEHSRLAVAVLPAIMTAVLAWHLASGLVLYWASSTAVGGLQAFLVGRKRH